MNETKGITDAQDELDKKLWQFNGTECYYEHSLNFMFSEGVHFLANRYGAYWLIDIIFSYQPIDMEGELQVWKLKRIYEAENEPTDRFMITCEDGNKNVLINKEIPFSDFSAEHVTLWFQNSVLYLPSEH